MADIELIIKIPEETKQAFDCAESNDLKGSYYDFGGVIGKAIANGKPLDSVLDEIKEEIKDNTYFINETTEKEGIDFETVEKIIDKYKER